MRVSRPRWLENKHRVSVDSLSMEWLWLSMHLYIFLALTNS